MVARLLARSWLSRCGPGWAAVSIGMDGLPRLGPPQVALGDDNYAVVDAVAQVERGRESYAREAWRDAYESLSAADQSEPLGAEDLDLLATCAYMIGHEADYLGLLERAHRSHLDAGQALAA